MNKSNLLYAVKGFDFDMGFQFNRMRYYSPNLGRFTQKDLSLKSNHFSYVENKVLEFIDPMGLYGVSLPLFSLPPYPGGGGEGESYEGTCGDSKHYTDCAFVYTSYESCMDCCDLRYLAFMERCSWWMYFAGHLV